MEIYKYIDEISKISLFKDSKKEDLLKLFSKINYNIKKYNKDSIVFSENDTFNYMCVLLDGEVILSKFDEFGNRNIIDVIKPFNIFAEVFSFTTSKVSPVSASTSKNSIILFINTDELLKVDEKDNIEIIREKHLLLDKLLSIFANKNLILLSKIEIISRRNIREKVLYFLSINKLKNNNSNIFNIQFSRKDMADFLGVDRSALSRELSKLRDEGIIDFDKNTFKILVDIEAKALNL